METRQLLEAGDGGVAAAPGHLVHRVVAFGEVLGERSAAAAHRVRVARAGVAGKSMYLLTYSSETKLQLHDNLGNDFDLSPVKFATNI